MVCLSGRAEPLCPDIGKVSADGIRLYMEDEKSALRCFVGDDGITVAAQPGQPAVVPFRYRALEIMLWIDPHKLWNL